MLGGVFIRRRNNPYIVSRVIEDGGELSHQLCPPFVWIVVRVIQKGQLQCVQHMLRLGIRVLVSVPDVGAPEQPDADQ